MPISSTKQISTFLSIEELIQHLAELYTERDNPTLITLTDDGDQKVIKIHILNPESESLVNPDTGIEQQQDEGEETFFGGTGRLEPEEQFYIPVDKCPDCSGRSLHRRDCRFVTPREERIDAPDVDVD